MGRRSRDDKDLVTPMSRKEPNDRRLRACAVLAAAAFAMVGAPSSVAAGPSAGVAGAGKLAPRAVAQAEEFWTAKRMKAAEPAEIELADESATPQDDPTPQDDGDGAPELQLGPVPYSSFELTDTTSYPNRVHGKVFFTKPGQGNFVCSGTVVDGVNDSTVVTAGHCLNDNGVWATNFAFVPGYRDGQAPFGVWAASSLYAAQPWVSSENLRYDFGVAVIARNTGGVELEDAVGARGIAFNQPAQQFYRSHGYPAAFPFNGSKLWACESDFGFFDHPWPNSGPATMAIGCNMTGGSSGGGWVIDDHNVVSLNSYKYTLQTEVMYGPHFGSTAKAVFDQASGAAPGASTTTVTPPPAAQPDPLTVMRCTKLKPKKKKKAKKRAAKSKKRKTAKSKKRKTKAKKSCSLVTL
jgi:V8-like Glu-specific endopeptidase